MSAGIFTYRCCQLTLGMYPSKPRQSYNDVELVTPIQYNEFIITLFIFYREVDSDYTFLNVFDAPVARRTVIIAVWISRSTNNLFELTLF